MEKKFELNGVEFKVGDKVRIERRENDYARNGMGEGVTWDNSWNGLMDGHIGTEGTITAIGRYGARIGNWNYPLSSLRNLSAVRKHGIKVGSKVRVIDGTGAYFFNDKEGEVFTVSKVDESNNSWDARDHSEDMISVVGGDGRMFAKRFELVTALTELPEVFTFSVTSHGGKYRMTKCTNGKYFCTDEKEVHTDLGRAAHYSTAQVLRYINEGAWTYGKDITPKVVYLVGPFSGSVYKFEVDAGVRTILNTGEVLKGITQASVDQRIREGWKEATADQIKDAEAKFAADAAKEAAAEAKAKALAEAESKVAYAQAALITAIQELAALKA